VAARYLTAAVALGLAWLAGVEGCGGASGSGGSGVGSAGSGGASGGSAGAGASGGSVSTGAAGPTGGTVGLDVSLPDSPADAPGCPEGGVPGDPGCDCGKLEFTIATQQSCAITVLPGFDLDGEGFISLSGQQHRVFAMDRWGAGHVVAWCDGTTLPQLLAAFDVAGYLAQKPSPKVASFGDDYLCKPGGIAANPVPGWVTYLGKDLPAQYKGNAALLAQDWDAMIFCGFRVPWTTDWTSELSEFVGQHGRGLLAVMEYESLAKNLDFTNMSKITAPAGIQFSPLNLPWAPSSTSVSIECVPDLPPPIK